VPLVLAAISGGYLFDGINWHRSAHLNPQALTRFQWLCDRLRNDGDRLALSAFVRLVLGRHPFEPIGHQAFYLNVSAGRYFLLLGALKALARRYAPEFDQYRISELCVGDGETWSRRLVEEVRQLAQVAAEDPALAARLTGDDDAAITDVLTGLADEHPFALAFSQFMDRFGHRCAREMELSTPRWREDPLAVMLMVRNYLTAPPAAFRDRHASFLAARNELREALPRAWQRRLAGYLTGRIRYYVSLRENTRHFHSMAMDVTRQKLLALEGRLMARQRLRAAGDVFYLTWGEAAALEAGNLQWSDVAEPIRRRRRQRRLSGRNPVRETLNLDSPVAPGPESASGPEGAILRGQCASPGVAEGRVRIVLDPSSASRLVPGDVLVAPFTDPAWTPLFPLAAAVVVEVGSYLSHAGTLAREYGIPCLVDVRHCTRRLREGQRVRVNASDGTVTMLEQD